MNPGFTIRLLAGVLALVLGTAVLGPGEAQAPEAAKKKPVLTEKTAASRFGWGGAMWDYAWELGESLSSSAYRGTNIKGGTWQDRSTGTGRAVRYGGGIEMMTGPIAGYGETANHYGTTSLTLQGKADKVGRWEVRERYRYRKNGGTRPFTFVFELIPEAENSAACPGQVITVARTVLGTAKVQIGVKNGQKRWSRTFAGYKRPEKKGRVYAVEVRAKKITWFINGQAIASIANKQAMPGVKLTPRMRLIGPNKAQPKGKLMRPTDSLIDWLRHWNLKRGKTAPKGVGLKSGGPAPC